ncbi:MAG TPA: radical SAM protein, partial [Candidatus Acidoferrum sp.]|nr:radical SAM protein [Candidatus Acidoferrum sp.]
MTTVDLLAQPLTDGFLRRIDYLRVSVTDKCNLRCVYCMPEAGLPWLQRDEILQYGEIAAIVRAAAAVGVRSIRLTGGEPLVRPALNELVAMISEVDGIDDIALSTNGMMLEEQLDGLCAAGLSRVNVSLDTLRPDRFEAIARRPGLDRVLRGIDAALGRGVGVKINCVVLGGQNDDELADFAELTMRHAVAVRFIELMPVRENVDLQRDAYVSSEETLERIGAVRALQPVDGPAGNGPARYFAFEGALGCVGVISPLSH